ncbi:hypothetical protein [Rhodovastum atsumiense]|uniref:hypothetical protein n=1 Tax=Rhodovastum atsumiense TaxID=504468 RepID=UPI001EF1445C|nr:hypothetical protein [Rhodovastum atsumiense]
MPDAASRTGRRTGTGFATCLQQQHAVSSFGRQPIGKRASRAAGANDDKVVTAHLGLSWRIDGERTGKWQSTVLFHIISWKNVRINKTL